MPSRRKYVFAPAGERVKHIAGRRKGVALCGQPAPVECIYQYDLELPMCKSCETLERDRRGKISRHKATAGFKLGSMLDGKVNHILHKLGQRGLCKVWAPFPAKDGLKLCEDCKGRMDKILELAQKSRADLSIPH